MSIDPISPASSQEPAALTFIEALRATAARESDRPAILAPGRPDLSFTAFLEHIEHTAGVFAGFGLKPGDCVALVMPNGPELVSAILASMTVCTTVIVNPDFKVEEFELFLRNSPAQVLIVPRDWATPAREAAQSLGIHVINLISAPEMPVGLFDLEGAVYAAPTFAQPDDVAVLLPTSGTTGIPKLVPYSHRQLLEDAQISVWRTLSLPPDERKLLLNILPLFHLFGFCNLATLAAFGFGIVAASEFSVQDFYAFLDEYRPIGCRALPVMIKAIIEAAPAYQEVIARSSLKMFSSSSAPLMPEMAANVERIFHAGVATTYGMTEVSTLSWMLTTLKETYKAGSVGKPFRKIVIMDADGEILPPGEVGEVVVWSENLFSGYINDPASQARFAHAEWFHTGDMGYLDDEQFLFIIGRFKEIINRGGEKIVPYEVEKVLIGHPAIKEAAIFGVPHLSLGEDVAAAIVVTDPALTARQVRQYLAQRLMPQQVPGFIVIVEQIPKTPTSKIQRIGLSKLLGLDNPNERRIGGQGHLGLAPTPPRTEIERQLVEIWVNALGIPEIGIHDDFFDLGGTSLQAAALVMRVAREFHTTLAVDTLFEAATIAEMAEVIVRPERDIPWPTLVPIQPSGTKPPFFCLPGLGGVVLVFRELALHLGSDQPIYGLQPPGIDGRTPPLTSIEDIALHFVQAMRSLQPNGPYMFGGYSFGAMVALEVAQILHAQGEEVGLLVSFDGPLDIAQHPRMKHRKAAEKFIRRVNRYWTRLALFNPPDEPPPILDEREAQEEGKAREPIPALPGKQPVSQANGLLALTYQPQPYAGRAVLFSARVVRPEKRNVVFEPIWEKIALGGIEICDVPGDHYTILKEPNVQVLAEKLKAYIERVLMETTES